MRHLGVLFGRGVVRAEMDCRPETLLSRSALPLAGALLDIVAVMEQRAIIMEGRGANNRRRLVALTIACWCAVLVVLVLAPAAVMAQDQDIGYFGKNRLEFATVEDSRESTAAGTGIVDYKGGKEPDSRWRATFRFSGLNPGNEYTVVIRGRTGEQSSDAASEFTALCSFTAERDGAGNCFWYFQGLARLNVVQLREGDADGQRVLQASRTGETGSIVTDPNRFSPGGENQSRKRS